MRKIESETNIGRQVICDICNVDHTDSPERGGMIFGSNAYCPICTAKAMPTIKKYHEEDYIKAHCPKGQSFADFVRAYRGGDGIIKVITADSIQELLGGSDA